MNNLENMQNQPSEDPRQRTCKTNLQRPDPKSTRVNLKQGQVTLYPNESAPKWSYKKDRKLKKKKKTLSLDLNNPKTS